MNNNNAQRHYLQIIAKKLRRAASGEVSSEAKEILGEIIICLANESGFGIDDAEIIERTFPLMIERVNSAYGRAIIQSLDAVLESCLPEAEQVAGDILDAEVIQ